MSQVVTEPELLERSHNLQLALASGRFDEICSNKTDSVWPYVAASLQQSPRAAVKKLLGFSPNNLEVILTRNKNLVVCALVNSHKFYICETF